MNGLEYIIECHVVQCNLVLIFSFGPTACFVVREYRYAPPKGVIKHPPGFFFLFAILALQWGAHKVQGLIFSGALCCDPCGGIST